MPNNIFKMSVSKTTDLPIIIGSTYSITIEISNLSQVERLYNLGLTLILPDGMSLSQASISQTSTINNADNSISYLWVNLKDLAPLETNYTFTLLVKCNTKFKNGSLIPFGYKFEGIHVVGQVDTMPRGIYDIGNEVLTNDISMTFITTRFSGTITTSSKVLKGAGYNLSLSDYSQINTATCKVINNSTSSSLVNITILLDDGIRYIGNILASGTDASLFLNPTISTISIDGKLYIQLYYGNINLSINSSTTINFSYAVWNQYNNNSGDFILHGTKLNMSMNMVSAAPLITATSYSSFKFSAMDLIITTSVNNSTVDVQSNVIFTYVFKVGQYYNIEDIVVNYLLPDGIYYLSSSTAPTSAVDNPQLQGFFLTYNFSFAAQNTTKTVTINAKIDSYYRYKFDSQSMNLPVVASDPFISLANISGILIGPLSEVTDSASVSCAILVATITKQFIKGYYKDGTAKTINYLAPGDLAEYLLTYNASALKAIQKQIYIDDFFPLSANPINNLAYEYTGISPVIAPQLISPHGVDFYYDDMAGLAYNTIKFKVPIESLGTTNQNINLMKLKGINTYGDAYSNSTQVAINIGTPNLTLTKTVTGPNKSAIQVNEIYTYTVTLSNSSNLGTETDAFDITLNDTLSTNWFSLNDGTVQVTGTGIYDSPIISTNNISVYINKLAPGTYVTLTYKVTISNLLAPGVSIITTATNTNPYSQIYDPNSSNFQYTNLNKSASVTLNSLGITLAKTNFSDVFKVGSPITYKLSLTVPKGTIAYNLYIKDVLPSGGQVYLGPSYRDGELISVTVSSNTITFPSEGNVDARELSKTITYIFTSKISNATKPLNAITSTQTNTLQCLYQQIENSSYTTISKTLVITINHPNILLSLSVSDITTSTTYTSNAAINSNDILQVKLIFQNNSNIDLIDGTIEIPIDLNLLFTSINSTVLCNAVYNEDTRKIIISIPKLASSQSGFILFTVLSKPTLNSGISFTMQGTAISYYNNISTTKVYGGETSNILTFSLLPNLSLKPDPLYKINDTTSFIVTPPGNNAVILNYFENIGGGYDEFNLKIQKSEIPYSLYIDEVKIADIPSDTLYNADLEIMANLPPNAVKIIKITATIPLSSLGKRYDFIVTAKSKTAPYPERTVLNIDPY